MTAWEECAAWEECEASKQGQKLQLLPKNNLRDSQLQNY